jgi:hypothetical protein
MEKVQHLSIQLFLLYRWLSLQVRHVRVTPSVDSIQYDIAFYLVDFHNRPSPPPIIAILLASKPSKV